METAAFMGISLSELNRMTPREYFIYEKGYFDRQELEQKSSIHQAYLISRWVWAKKVDIEKILDFKEEKKEMTTDQMLAQVKVLNALFGGEVKTCNP